MDDQEKQDDQKIQDDQRDLLLKIARCNVADRILDLLISGMSEKEIPEALRNESEKGNEKTPDYLNCQKICEYQYKKISKAPDDSGSEQEFSKAMFHVPEPWNGNLKTAKILFVGPNPSINLKEKFPKFESEKWSEDKKNEVVDFFSDRLNLLDLKNDIKKTPYWREIYKYAAYILKVKGVGAVKTIEFGDKEKEEIDSQIALTEIVHCKSTSQEEGGVDEAAETCFKKYTKKVIEYFLETPPGSGEKKTVVFLGGIAKATICAEAGTDKDNIDRKKIADYFGVSKENARFLFIYHPNARGLTHGQRQDRINEEKRIDEEQTQYG